MQVCLIEHYDPWGLNLAGIERQGAPDHLFQYNGKERQTELGLNWSDYGTRMYDTQLGRFNSVDRYAHKYLASPYAYVLNNPTNAIDPDGNLVLFVSGFKLGEWLSSRVLGPWLYGNQGFGSNRPNYYDYTYWQDDRGRMDMAFINRIGDHNTLYYEGMNAPLSSASTRRKQGLVAGRRLVNDLKSGRQSLADGETIKIVSHSQGSAYASGIEEVLTEAGYKVEVIYNLAPKQPGDIGFSKGIRTVQYGSDKDQIAPQSPIPNISEQSQLPDRFKGGASGGHELGNYWYIFSIPSTEQGYVAPRQDNPSGGKRKADPIPMPCNCPNDPRPDQN